MLVRILSNYFVAGYDIPSGNIAPIIKYMQGWSITKIKNYCTYKGWMCEIYRYKIEVK